MRIAVTGSFGAGKTTLVKRLAEEFGEPYYSVPEMSSPLWQAGKAATQCTRDELIELLTRRLMDRAALELDKRTVISDGSLIHDWVFVRTMLMHGPRPGADARADATWQIESIEPMRRAVQTRMKDLYDVVVHLPIEFPLEPNNQPVSDKFRELSDSYLLTELDHMSLPYITVSGPLDVRFDHILGALPKATI